MHQDSLKKIYFIRHGRTKANGSLVFQKPEEPLSDIGRNQAVVVATWLKGEGIDTLMSSSFPRAVETASIIGKQLGLPVIETDSVVELHRPKSLYGRSYFSPRVLGYVWQLYWHSENPSWHYEGAENISMVRERIETAKQEILAEEGERMVVVSHRFFIALFVIAVCAKGPLKLPSIFRQLLIFFKAKNTAVFKFTVDTKAADSTCKWLYQGIQKTH